MEEILELLQENNIDLGNNKFLLGKTYQELSCKINYLKSNDMYIIEDGKVHEIFWLSYKSLEKRYGITREELFNKYKDKCKMILKTK